ncbi:hypothetical protein YTPLAS18_10310 [Nitrospira sp.]|nr:hypothetical protein YTPLAS18_10310 [Nitrospira sp.]
MNSLWSAIGLGVLLVIQLGGCQSTPPPAGPSVSDHASFDRLWKAYTRCVSSSDLEAARQQAALLHHAAYRDQGRTFLPSTLDQYVQAPPARLAADPRELAMACRNHVDHIESVQASR